MEPTCRPVAAELRLAEMPIRTGVQTVLHDNPSDCPVQVVHAIPADLDLHVGRGPVVTIERKSPNEPKFQSAASAPDVSDLPARTADFRRGAVQSAPSSARESPDNRTEFASQSGRDEDDDCRGNVDASPWNPASAGKTIGISFRDCVRIRRGLQRGRRSILLYGPDLRLQGGANRKATGRTPQG